MDVKPIENESDVQKDNDITEKLHGDEKLKVSDETFIRDDPKEADEHVIRRKDSTQSPWKNLKGKGTISG